LDEKIGDVFALDAISAHEADDDRICKHLANSQFAIDERRLYWRANWRCKTYAHEESSGKAR